MAIANAVICRNAAIEGGAIFCDTSALEISRSTIAHNATGERGVLTLWNGWRLEVEDSIVWGNVGDAAWGWRESSTEVTRSCIQGREVWPGEGNILADPRFGGRERSGRVAIHSQEDLAAALGDFSYALAPDSPCLGAGDGGVSMGAWTGTCAAAGDPGLTLVLSPGEYDLAGLTLAADVSVEGAGAETTTLRGTLWAPPTGARVADVTVTGGALGGVVVGGGEAPTLEGCVITANADAGLRILGLQGGAGGGDGPRIVGCDILRSRGPGVVIRRANPRLVRCTISGNITEEEWGEDAGGGVRCEEGSEATLDGCVIAGNRAVRGGALSCDGASVATVRHSTISGNFAPEGGAISCRAGGGVVLESSIVWDNCPAAPALDGDSSLEASCSCVEGGLDLPGEGTIDRDPLFCGWESAEVSASTQEAFEASLAGYRLSLSPGSPCIGAGRDGSNQGADLGVCGAGGAAARVVELGAGRFAIGERSLVHPVSLRGAGAEVTTIVGTLSGLRSGQSIADLSIEGGPRGGVVVAGSEGCEIRDCRVRRNAGPGVACRGASVAIVGCRIEENDADEADGENHGLGGGVFADGSVLTLTGCSVLDNHAGYGGGGIFLRASDATLTDCRIAGNAKIGSSTMVVRGGGGVSLEASSARLVDCEVRENTSSSQGGGIFASASELWLEGCVVDRNVVTGTGPQAVGGGVGFRSSSVRVDGSRVSGNRAGSGGGIGQAHGNSGTSTLDVTRSRIVGNLSGGIWLAGGLLSVEGCELSANAGDGLEWFATHEGDAMSAVNSVFAGNSGAGLEMHMSGHAGVAGVLHSTIVANGDAGVSGPDWGEDARLTSCIVWGNGSPLAEPSALLVESSCVAAAELAATNGNLPGPPQFRRTGVHDFERFAPDGRPDFLVVEGDWRLRPTSPCIDTGRVEGAPAVDIDGNPRPSWGGVDMGAYEYVGDEEPRALVAFRRGRVNPGPEIDLSDAVSLLEHLFLGADEPSCLDAADVDDDGALSLTDAVRILAYLFQGGAPPAEPFERCATDPDEDALGCREFTGCEP